MPPPCPTLFFQTPKSPSSLMQVIQVGLPSPHPSKKLPKANSVPSAWSLPSLAHVHANPSPLPPPLSPFHPADGTGPTCPASSPTCPVPRRPSPKAGAAKGCTTPTFRNSKEALFQELQQVCAQAVRALVCVSACLCVSACVCLCERFKSNALPVFPKLVPEAAAGVFAC